MDAFQTDSSQLLINQVIIRLGAFMMRFSILEFDGLLLLDLRGLRDEV